MADTMTVKEAAALWNISERRISTLCSKSRIPGVRKEKGVWLIPANAEKPADNRIKSGAYIKHADAPRLPLPIGISDYRLASTEYYYVDKTLLIKDFLDERPKVSLFTRPRRFGKTLNMDMLRTFFEKTDEDTSVYFNNKKIWACGQKYRDYQGKYPVIFITLKDVKLETWGETLAYLSGIFASEYDRHKELLHSEKCSDIDKAYFTKVIDRTASQTELQDVLRILSQMLDAHYGIAPIIIIDEYDTPIQQGHMCGFYDEVILFMRNFFSGGLKDNKHLSYGFLTGILRIAKESIFSGLNNLKINSVLDNKYSEYFGFTSDEVKQMAKYYRATEKYGEVCLWYDGYRFGKTDIFNPWSVINYFSNECAPRAFWQSTGSNDIINEILSHADQETTENLQKLILGETVSTKIDTGVIYPQIQSNPSSIYSFLLMAGYLKTASDNLLIGGSDFYAVAIPNKEIMGVYNNEILNKLVDIIPESTASAIQLAIYSGNSGELKKQLHKLLLQSASCYDTAKESFYHGFMLGLCAIMDNRYYVSSNRESGEGRFDISLRPKVSSLPGILIELKACKACNPEQLKALSAEALQQIHDKKYDTDMITNGVQTIFKFGVAFSGKTVEISAQ